MFPSIWLKKCKGFEYCKSEEEIDEFASQVYVNIYVRSSIYSPDKYDGDHIEAEVH